MIRAFIQQRHSDSGKYVLQALVPFLELMQCAIFTQRTDHTEDTKEDIDSDERFYQRRLDNKRLMDIMQYIYRSILDEKTGDSIATLFPSSMILSVELDDFTPSADATEENFQLPNRVYIVDGQHRMMAMKKLYEKLKSEVLFVDGDSKYVLNYLEKFCFSCTILVNYDLWEQGQVFANVNFKQKPVNRSLYYDIYGSEYRENTKDWTRNSIYLAHHLARFMNENKKSPYYRKIKMLGTGKGYVSQSFFVEALMRHLRPNGLWWFDADSPKFSKHTYQYMAVELLTFYDVVHELFDSYWPQGQDERGTIICKTTGTGAFIHLIADMRARNENAIHDALLATPLGELCDIYRKRVVERLTPIVDCADTLFGKNSKYAGTGGRGLENALYKEMHSKILRSRIVSESSIFNKSIEERLTKLEMLKSSQIIFQLNIKGIKNLNELLENYFTNHNIDDIEALGHHYEFSKISFIRYSLLENFEDKYHVCGNCNVSFTTYLDQDNNLQIPLTMPCSFSIYIENKNGSWQIQEDNVKVVVDTSAY